MRSGIETLLIACGVTIAVTGARIQAKPHPQQLFVTVRDASGIPIRSLQAADFEVSEGGKRREVTKAALAPTVRARIALLIDNGFLSGGTVTPLRSALESLVNSLSSEDDVTLGTLSPQFRIRVKPTSNRSEVMSGINNLFAMATSGTALVDGVIEMDDRFVKPASDRWPVFVIITSDSPEVSGRQTDDFNRRIHELAQRGARAHAILIEASSHARGNEPELSMALTQSTGGTYEAIAAVTALSAKMTAIAADIAKTKHRAADEYLIEFMRETDNAPVDVAVKTGGATVRASMSP